MVVETWRIGKLGFTLRLGGCNWFNHQNWWFLLKRKRFSMLELAVLHDIYKCLGWWLLINVTSEHFPTSVEIDRWCKNKHGTKLGTPGRTDLVLVPIHHQVLGVIVFRFVQSGIYPKKALSMQKNVDHPFFSVSRRLSWKVLGQKCLSIKASVSKSCFVSKIVCSKPCVCVCLHLKVGCIKMIVCEKACGCKSFCMQTSRLCAHQKSNCVPCFPPGADFGSQLPVTRGCDLGGIPLQNAHLNG
jgi:hypothetical protein